jgi:prostamide/prostaglandin F2alpha synthase
VDNDMQCYKALDYKRFSIFSLMKKLLSETFRSRKAKADGMGITGDMKGDGFQNGGALIVAKGGKQLFEYIQEDASIQITEEQILKTLKLNKN